MGVTHRKLSIRMPKDLLQREDIPTFHNEVTGEGVPKNVGRLAFGQFYA